MIISNQGLNKFTIRNRLNLSIIATIDHNFGFLNCGLYYPETKGVLLGIEENLVEFDYEKMKIIKHVQV